MGYRDEFRQCLERGDWRAAQKLWAHVFPGYPPPKTDEEAEQTMHVARTGMKSLKLKPRAYSHAWLRERGLVNASQLPDNLRQSAERLYPVIVEGVGIAVGLAGSASPARKQFAAGLRDVMSEAVADCYANGDKDPGIVKARILSARDKFIKAN